MAIAGIGCTRFAVTRSSAARPTIVNCWTFQRKFRVAWAFLAKLNLSSVKTTVSSWCRPRIFPNVEILEVKEDKRSVRLDGIRRIRKRRNYRERPLYVMDTRAFYMDVIDHCEELVLKRTEPPTQIGPQ